jgi:hypothetical protein
MVPLSAFDYFPSQDGLSHLYNATIIRNYTREEFAVYREFYTLRHTLVFILPRRSSQNFRKWIVDRPPQLQLCCNRCVVGFAIRW